MGKQFTAGPWNVAGCEIFSADNDKMIARVFSGSESNVLLSGAISAHEADCNAALISAAPELLAALEAIMKEIVFIVEDGTLPQSALEHETMMKARAAIERAKQ